MRFKGLQTPISYILCSFDLEDAEIGTLDWEGSIEND
jgi:hypothetical protein